MHRHRLDSVDFSGNDLAFTQEARGNGGSGHQAATPMTLSSLWSSELEALKRAQETHARSMMVLVHELRSPAAASKSMVATLRYLRPEPSQIDDILARIESRMDHLLDLVEDLLDLSQAKAGSPLEEPAGLDLVAETHRACQPYVDEAATRGLEMLVEAPASPVPTKIARRAYQLIVSNLVSNAVKYTPSGSVRVVLRKAGNWVVLKVDDTGIGIPADEICHLFTEFFRATNARESRVRGTGLGLAAVKALVEDCGGRLMFQSQQDRGSTVVVYLPLSRAGAAPAGEPYPRARTTVQ